MFEQFTERARKVMVFARHEAQRLNSEFIGTEHVLLGIAKEGEGAAVKALKFLGILPAQIIEVTEAWLRERTLIPGVPPTVQGQLPFSPRCKRVIELAGESANQLGADCVATEHLLLGLHKENEGIAFSVLAKLGVSLDKLVGALRQTGSLPGEDTSPSKVQAGLVKYGRTGPSFKTPNGTLLSIAELLALVDRQVVKASEVRQLVWGAQGDDAKMGAVSTADL